MDRRMIYPRRMVCRWKLHGPGTAGSPKLVPGTPTRVPRLDPVERAREVSRAEGTHVGTVARGRTGPGRTGAAPRPARRAGFRYFAADSGSGYRRAGPTPR